LRKLLDPRLILLCLALLPPDEAAADDQKKHHCGRDPAAIALEKILNQIATQVLVDFADEGVADLRGLRQEGSSVG
jgi:hypothetical protein